MPKRGKRFNEANGKIDPEERYALSESIDLVKATSIGRFDSSIDVAVRLGVNPRHADQMVRGACSLPHGTGKPVRILVFAQGDAARAAEEAGADHVGSDEYVQKIQKEGWLDFDKAIATRNMMGRVGRLGRILGPRGLMPNPKVGTVVAPDPQAVGDAVRALKRGKIDFRVEKAGIVHASIGRASMSADHLTENFCALLHTLLQLKPTTAKGTYVRSIAISSTMGPSVRVDANDAQRLAESV